MEVSSHDLYYDTVFGGPTIHVSRNVVKAALEPL